MKALLSLFVFLFCAHAGAVSLSPELIGFIGVVGPRDRVMIDFVEGKVKISRGDIDRTVDAQIVSDQAAADGPLELDLGEGEKLLQQVGMLDGSKLYFVTRSGVRVELVPQVTLNH